MIHAQQANEQPASASRPPKAFPPMKDTLRSLLSRVPWLRSGLVRLRGLGGISTANIKTSKERLEDAYSYDRTLFETHAAYSTGTLYREVCELSDGNLEALINIEYHRLEKGLSHRQRRAQFGLDAAERLQAALNVANTRGLNTQITDYADSVLKSYWRVIQEKEGQTIGWRRLSREEVQNRSAIKAQEFFESRHSIRCFDDKKTVDRDWIMKAVNMARYTPSVCNRQTWRVVLCETDEAKAKALALQNGNVGFGHLASHVLLVASDRNCFASIGERNQPWIETGMFAMSLIYALHAMGLGTCCLNWSVEPEKDEALKRDLDLPESFAIGMMIAVGALPDEILVAESRRVSLDQILTTR
jgi:nitroreductase